MTPELAQRVCDGLRQAGVDFLTYLPESRLIDMLPLLEAEPELTLVQASHEGTALSVACGAAFAGKQAAVYMEATGLFLSLYNTQGVAIRFGLPLVLLVSYVGSPGDQANSATFTGWGQRAERVLQAMGIQYIVVEDGNRIELRIADAVRAANAAKAPVCMLFTGEFTAFHGEWK